MKLSIGTGRAGVALALLMVAGAAQAQQSFVVGGPLDVFRNLSTSEEQYNYTWIAKVTYDPDVAIREIYGYANYDQSFFYDSIISITYSIYDANNQLVVSGLEPGHVGNVVSAVNDINPNDSIYDQSFWYADDPFSFTESMASIGFRDMTGTMIDTVELYPDPPQLGEFDYGGSTFYSFTPDTGEGFLAWGKIKMRGDTDPVASCLTGARNHGALVSCTAKLLNGLRSAGEISGREKGQWLTLTAIKNQEGGN